MPRTTAPRPRSDRRVALIRAMAVVLALSSAACGSTALVDGELPQAAAGDPGGAEAQQGLTVAQPGSAPPGPATGQAATTADGSTGTSSGSLPQTAAPGTGGSAGTSSNTSGGQGGGAQPQQPQSDPGQPQQPASSTRKGVYGPGVTDEEVVVGIAIADDASRAQNATLLGASNITQGDTERYYDIMAEYLNERGGIAGRTLRYSKWRFSTADGENQSQLEQSACAYWTQDDPALVAPAITESDNFLGCAQDAGLGTWTSGLTTADDRTLAAFPTHLMISAISLTRQGAVLAEGLESQDYFDQDYKLGVVTYDGPAWKRAVDGSLEPALNSLGRKIHEKAFLREMSSNAELGDLTAQIQSTVLRFKTEGITHVTFLDERGVITLLFTRSAENQDYRPRYGMTSQAGNTVIAQTAPSNQFEGALGVGWIPALDVPASEMPENAAAEECLARFKEQGEEPANANNKAVMLSICEVVFFVKAALEAGLPDLTAASYQRGAESLGAFQALNSFGNYWSPERHDGASHYRHVAYDGACNCFHYTSEPISNVP